LPVCFTSTFLFGFGFTSSSDSDSSLTLFIVAWAFEGGFFAGPPVFDGSSPLAFEGGFEVAINGGLVIFPFGSPSSSSSVANGSSSTSFFLSWSLGFGFGFEVDSVVPPPLLLPSTLNCASSFLGFAASRLEKNSSLSF
jgi:hypothetical protein